MNTEKIQKSVAREVCEEKTKGKQKHFRFLRVLRVLRVTHFLNVKPGAANRVGHERRHQIFNRQTHLHPGADV
jgi:hypothetical protein